MTAPAARLLAAADLLDKRASEATEGPWNILTGPRYVFLDGFSGHDVDGPNDGFIARGTRWVDGTYIALMHPEVGKALAAWLRRESKKPMILDPHQWGAFADGTLEEPEREIWSGDEEALALADLVLAGGS